MPPQTLDSLHLYHTALSSLSLPIPPSPSPSPSPSPPSLPPSKHIPKTGFLVDSFRSPCPPSFAYFLSHFHSDHYSGLSPGWSLGLIFSSPITSRLLVNILKIPHQFVFPLPLREPVIIDGVEVTLIDANHCPGAVQFLFRVPGKIPKTYVHTGDFRYCSKMREDDILKRFAGCDAVFLDTTYCNPKFVFPSQEESVDYVVSVIESVEREVRGLERGVLFLVATYVVGKEKILLEIARRCGRKVHVDGRKMEVLRVLGYGESGVFTEDERESDVHVVGWNVLGETWPYFRPNFSGMKEIMDERGYSRVVGFVPTGWTYEVKRNKFAVRSKDSFEIHLVPYSEHSNYNELREYVKFLRPKHVIPTVGIDVEKLDSKHADKMRKHFVGLVDEMANKKEFFMAFLRGSSVNDEKVEMDVVSDSKEDLDQGKEVKSSETERIEGNVQDAVLNSSTTLQEPVSENLCAVSDDETEKAVQELKDSLPAWVTREQLLGLISSSGWNVVEAVSSFYECETEFHEQVFTHETSLSASETGARGSELLNKPVSPKRSHESFSFPLSQNYKSPKAKPSVKRGISHGKTKRDSNNKSGKKAKINLKPESGGSKQSTITKFFSKVLPNISQGITIGITSEESPTVAIPMVDDDAKLYAGEIDQFIKIIGGNESSESYAAMMLERTNGDINRALDMHYGNPEADLRDSVGQSLGSRNLVQIQPSANDCPSVWENTVQEEAQLAVDLSVTGLSTHNVDATLVSLPLEKYNPVEHACWVAGQPAPYIHLARTFDLVEAEKGKIKATSMLCNMFRSLLALAPEDVLPAVYLCTNKIAANYENVELNIGGSLVTSALEEACGTTRSRIREMYNNFGDLGDVAQLCRQTQKLLASPPPLLIRDVLSVLRKISVQAGSRSTSRKKSLIVNLIRSCREKEVKFIIRTLVRNLRIGAMMRTVLPALAQAVGMHFYDNCFEGGPKDLKEKLQYLSAAAVEAYNIVPNLDMVVPSLLNKGFEFSSSTLSMVPGIPIKPMLAKITNGVPEVLDILQNKAFTCEYKYDGQRAQIHRLPDGSVRIFSRKGDETTSRFPDLINIIEESCKHAAATFIVDAEVVAIDRRNGCKLMSFQELSSRERGSKDSTVTMANIKVDICVFVFDIMFAHGEKLLELPLRQRRKYLKELFCDEKLGYLEYAKEITIEAEDACLTNEETITKINTFLQYALHSSCEGIMVKSLDVDAEYCPSKRTDTWLKVKRDYVDGLNDSLDLVPIGAWHGNGRKAGWYSPFLMACYSPETEEFQSVCRVMSGFSDTFYAEMKEYFSEDRILSKKPSYYRTAEVPDMWFSPSLVWAIRGADFSVSPVHQAAVGLVHPTRGISMRFPRFVQSVCDRSPEECSTAADIADMFNSQTRKMNVTAPT